MKSFPSCETLNDAQKRNFIERVLVEIKLNLATYMALLCNTIIKEKQILTKAGIEVLMLPEHYQIYEYLKTKYPERNLESMYIKYINNK